MKNDVTVFGLPVKIDRIWSIQAAHFRFGLGMIVDVIHADHRLDTFRNVSKIECVKANGMFQILIESNYHNSSAVIPLGFVSINVTRAREGHGTFAIRGESMAIF